MLNDAFQICRRIRKEDETEPASKLSDLEESMETLDITDANTLATGCLDIESPKRSLRARTKSVSYEYNLHRIKDHKIARSKKFTSLVVDDDPQKSIEKLYLDKSLDGMKVSNLETIFEEPEAAKNGIIFGTKKMKRSLTLKDGFTTTRTLKERRKRLIQKRLGKVKRFKRISMETFLEHLQSLSHLSNTNEETVTNDSNWHMKSSNLENVQEISIVEEEISN